MYIYIHISSIPHECFWNCCTSLKDPLQRWANTLLKVFLFTFCWHNCEYFIGEIKQQYFRSVQLNLSKKMTKMLTIQTIPSLRSSVLPSKRR